MKLFKITVKSKNPDGGEELHFNVGATNIIDCLTKFKRIPDSDYIYSEEHDILTVTCEGDLI